MADDKKNISDDRKVDKPPEPGKVESAKAVPPVQDQPAPAGKEAPKDKDAPAPSMEGAPQPGKDEKQTTILGMGDPALAGKVVDFTAARNGATTAWRWTGTGWLKLPLPSVRMGSSTRPTTGAAGVQAEAAPKAPWSPQNGGTPQSRRF